MERRNHIRTVGYNFPMASSILKPWQLQAWWAHRQGLDGSLSKKSPAEVLESVGWARSVAGVNPYLTLFSRAGFSRESIDKAVADCEILELPSARGCTYIVPASDFALALICAQGFAEESEMKMARKLGVTDSEIDKLCGEILGVLKSGPLDPDGIRKATGDYSRSLGPDGQKKGVSTTLPLSLGQLQVYGRIRRISTNGRLDQQRYQYTLWPNNPLARCKWTKEEAYTELARRYFRWIGPATLSEFQWFSGLGVKAANAALDPLGLIAVDETRLLPPEQLDKLQSFKPGKKLEFKLVASMDSMVLLRRKHSDLLAEADTHRKILGDKGLAILTTLADLPSHAIFNNHGRLTGFWEYDKETEQIAWGSFIGKNTELDKAVKGTEAFVRDQLGDARSFSLDSPKTRGPRIASVKEISAL